jgi:hypothetical protein
MKAEVKTPVLVAVVVAGILVLSYFLLKTMGSAGNLDQGQVQYTPGKPPWEETDASKKGPGTSPGASSGAAPSGVPSAAPATTPTGAAPAPPGMSAPEISSK